MRGRIREHSALELLELLLQAVAGDIDVAGNTLRSGMSIGVAVYPTDGNDPAVLPGPDDVFQSYGLAWANASNTPFRLYKHWVHEGGIATPFIAHWPAVIQKPAITQQPAQS